MKVSAAAVVSIAVLCGAVATGTKLGEYLVARPLAGPGGDAPSPPPIAAAAAPALESLGDGLWGCGVPCVLIVPVTDPSSGQIVHLRMVLTPDEYAPGRARVLIQFSSPSGEPIDPARSPIALGVPWLERAHMVEQ